VVVLLVLFLEQTMDLEPIGPAAVPGPALGHAHHQTLAQPARLARRPVLLVDHALAVVLALRYRTQIVVSPAEERLKHVRKYKKQTSRRPIRDTREIFEILRYDQITYVIRKKEKTTLEE